LNTANVEWYRLGKQFKYLRVDIATKSRTQGEEILRKIKLGVRWFQKEIRGIEKLRNVFTAFYFNSITAYKALVHIILLHSRADLKDLCIDFFDNIKRLLKNFYSYPLSFPVDVVDLYTLTVPFQLRILSQGIKIFTGIKKSEENGELTTYWKS